MTDKQIDTLLREHGESWRAANQHRPAIDWEDVLAPSRSRIWLALAAAAVAAAAIIVPLALVAAAHHGSSSKPAHPTVKEARKGAPPEFFAIAPPSVSGNGGASVRVAADGDDSVKPPHLRATAIGVTVNGLRSYSAYPKPGCKTSIQSFYFQPKRDHGVGLLASGNGYGDVLGVVARIPMAVSPDGTQLAFVVDRLPGVAGGCVAAQQLDVFDLASKQVTAHLAPTGTRLVSLSWAPDSRHLAFEMINNDCVTGCHRVRPTTAGALGVHLLDASTSGIALAKTPRLLAERDQTAEPDLAAPVFYWHGQLAMILDGGLVVLDGHGGVGPALKTGFPLGVLSVSSDRSGDHLLMVAGPFANHVLTTRTPYIGGGVYGSDVEVVVGQTYRWDNGVLSKVSGGWVQPGW